ncbi:unnamed protein product [Microthlaspi erraticum]|uniref:F-box domain-containing protein n=1 Tax=Microthlaspi erraticum TaxID=1685480 RepID=A0A6D2I5L7_9BRAS|nr:unnamed protein product [Microthlaspi erraticum]
METQRKKLTKGSVNSNSLPVDLMMEILKRLPLKLIVKFLCVSKLWASMFRSPYFMKLFLKESLTRPKSLIFVFRKKYKCPSSFTSVYLKNTIEASSSSSSSSCSVTYHVICHTRQRSIITPCVHGLICYGPASRIVIYNPCTRRSVTLPAINAAGKRPIDKYLGFDPIDSDYKVLCIVRSETDKKRSRRGLAEEIWVLTLGTRNSWRRMIEQDVIPPHSPVREQLCINGVLYYRAFTGAKLNDSAIMSFDVRSEKLDLIKGPCTFPEFSKLTSYEGKLAVRGHLRNFQRFSATDADTGEIIFTQTWQHASLPSAVYYDLKNNSVRNFEIQGTKKENMSLHADSASYSQVDNMPFHEDSVSSSLVDNLMFL